MRFVSLPPAPRSWGPLLNALSPTHSLVMGFLVPAAAADDADVFELAAVDGVDTAPT